MTLANEGGVLRNAWKPGVKREKKETLSPLSAPFLKYALLAVLALFAGMAAAAWVTGGRGQLEDLSRTGVQDRVAGSLIRHAEPQPVADIVFTDAGGQVRRLSEWRGKAVLLNLWATWCAPCKAEMPSLDRLQSQLAGNGFAVIALSMDRTGLTEPSAFFAAQGIAHLQLYNDSTGEAIRRLKAPGLPFTAVFNEKGEEVARIAGPAQWDGAAMIAQLKALR